jgi:hypothetical protein
MKIHSLILAFVSILAVFGLASCTNPAVLKIATPAVQAQVLGDAEKVLLAGGGALLISGGNGAVAVAAMTKAEMDNLPGLQKTLNAAIPATTTGGTVPVVPTPNALLPTIPAPSTP